MEMLPVSGHIPFKGNAELHYSKCLHHVFLDFKKIHTEIFSTSLQQLNTVAFHQYTYFLVNMTTLKQ